MGVHYKLGIKVKRDISKFCDECLRKEEQKWRSPYESAYYDAIVTEIKRRKKLGK
jgi:DNA-binding ferritin-like protein (Dps family)